MEREKRGLVRRWETYDHLRKLKGELAKAKGEEESRHLRVSELEEEVEKVCLVCLTVAVQLMRFFCLIAIS